MTFNNEEHSTKTHQLVYSENWRSKLAYILNNDEFIKPSWNHPIRIDGYHGCIAPNKTVKEDINLIDTSDIVFAFLNRPCLDGTVVELVHAANQQKPIFCMVTPDKNYDNLKNFYRKFSIPSTEYEECMGGYSGEYWFLLNYLNITLKHKLFVVESNMSWNSLGDIDESTKIKTDFMMFLIENGFILTNYDKYIKYWIDIYSFAIISFIFLIVYEWIFFAYVYPSMMTFSNGQVFIEENPAMKKMDIIEEKLNKLLESKL